MGLGVPLGARGMLDWLVGFRGSSGVCWLDWGLLVGLRDTGRFQGCIGWAVRMRITKDGYVPPGCRLPLTQQQQLDGPGILLSVFLELLLQLSGMLLLGTGPGSHPQPRSPAVHHPLLGGQHQDGQ